MTTQEIPAYRPQETKVLIGAGTALKAGFFFALGATLFSILISAVLGVLALVLGISLLPDIQNLFGR
ncbi:hypothetical protein [Microlunatus soli]|uniref:Uncharacterized protein n=1 Tax=Microlunatus soli TaxID=630515 RepID=A0A1H1WWW2_9ACTN|nr:hypothetical protein [Microlunatus soli]SDT00836.1 hypothetical protein SAMN04489812_3812 [Microlunatus soli]